MMSSFLRHLLHNQGNKLPYSDIRGTAISGTSITLAEKGYIKNNLPILNV